jgi:hypothetical protein
VKYILEILKNRRGDLFEDFEDVFRSRGRREHPTVPIYNESRLAKLKLDDANKTKLDEEFEEAIGQAGESHQYRIGAGRGFVADVG